MGVNPSTGNAQSDLALPTSYSAYLPASGYTAADVMGKVLSLDGPGSTLDADMVSGYGIGTISQSYAIGTNLDTDFIAGGNYSIKESTTTGGTWTGITKTGYGLLRVGGTYGGSNFGIFQEYFPIDSVHKYRRYRNSAASWQPWVEFWDASSDGNGGQPPAPKPYNVLGAIGVMGAIDVASGGTLTMPAGSGTYEWIVLTYGASVGGYKAGQAAAGVSPAGTASANLTVLTWRIL